jgi:hypothetical protein
MTQDVPPPPSGFDAARYRAWDGTMWPDPDSRDVHNHTHPTGGIRRFVPLSWTSDGWWGSIKG